MAPDRLINLIRHRVYVNADEDGRNTLDDALQEAEDAWAPLLHPEGTDDRPLGAPSWWSEETAAEETLAGMRTLKGRTRTR